MSSTYRIHGTRYLRKYTAPEKSSIYAYMADVRRIADTLCKVPWERVKGGDIAATFTLHTEEGLDWNTEERDRFDAAEWCAEHSDGMHRAYAQAACYVFEMPQSAVGATVEKVAVNVTSDPYNPYGARISAMTSATLDIPMDCATVRTGGTGGMFRAPDEDGMGAAPRLYVENADGTQTWYTNTENVELEPASGSTFTLNKYLFVFVCLENYNRGRNGWIEGSSYIENDVSLTLSTACADLDADELNDLSAAREPTVLKLINLQTNEVEDTITLSGPVYSMIHSFGEPYGGNIPPSSEDIDDMSSEQSAKLDGPYLKHQYAIINGDFDEYSMPGIPGLVIYDFATREIVSINPPSFDMSPELSTLFRKRGVELVSSQYDSLTRFFSLQLKWMPKIPQLPNLRMPGIKDRESVFSAAAWAAKFDFSQTSYDCKAVVPFSGSASGPADATIFIVRDDSIGIASDIFIAGSNGGAIASYQEDNPAFQTIPLSGKVSSISYSPVTGNLIVAGKCSIGGNTAAVKAVTSGGDVRDYQIDLTPDNYEDFSASEFMAFAKYSPQIDVYPDPWPPQDASGSMTTDRRFLASSSGNHLITANGVDNPETRTFAGAAWERDTGWNESFRDTRDTSVIKPPISNFKHLGGLLLTGRFTQIGGVKANGAAILMAIRQSVSDDCWLTIHPFDVGPVKKAVMFCDAANSFLPLYASHMLVDPAEV